MYSSQQVDLRWDQEAQQLGGVLVLKRVLMGTPNREPREYSRHIIEYEDLGRHIPIIFLLYSWGSLLEFTVKSL